MTSAPIPSILTHEIKGAVFCFYASLLESGNECRLSTDAQSKADFLKARACETLVQREWGGGANTPHLEVGEDVKNGFHVCHGNVVEMNGFHAAQWHVVALHFLGCL